MQVDFDGSEEFLIHENELSEASNSKVKKKDFVILCSIEVSALFFMLNV